MVSSVHSALQQKQYPNLQTMKNNPNRPNNRMPAGVMTRNPGQQ